MDLRTALALLLALCSVVGARAAQDTDLINSKECKEARATFDAAFAAARQKGDAAKPQLDQARHAAALACFGEAAAAPAGLRAPQPVVAVPSRPAATRALPAITPPAPPVAIQRPSVITSCDASGCWANDGTRLNRVGPQLVGPGGLCGVQGSVASCP